MRRALRPLSACVLAIFLVVLVTGIGSAQEESSSKESSSKSEKLIVRPGESIQAAVDVAKPGDTIRVIGGVHHESVVISKNGVALQGHDTSLKPPANPPTDTASPCEVSGFCVLGEVNSHTGEASRYVKNVSISGFTIRNFPNYGIVAFGAQNAEFVTNRAYNNGEYGITAFFSKGTQILANLTSGSDDAGIYVGDSPHANATIASNNTYGNFWGVLVRNALHGRITGNEAHNNCVGIFFVADAPGPAGEFDVLGNTVNKNTRACPAREAPPLSRVGVGLFGARGVEIRGNHILKNIPSGHTIFSGGVAVVRGLEGTPPTHNTVVGNMILNNRPDIFWDKSGSHNRFVGNICETSKPGGLCKRR